MKERLVQFKCSGSGWGNTCDNKQVFDMNNLKQAKELQTSYGNIYRCNDCKKSRIKTEEDMRQKVFGNLLKYLQ
tara:strand:- start:322 stop:543 length:222 start_codon:yes stop_codon:yes gene_type:complete